MGRSQEENAEIHSHDVVNREHPRIRGVISPSLENL